MISFGGKAEVPSVGILMMENLGNEDEEFWQTPTKKDGKRSFVVRARGIDTYYTEQEFTDHIFAVNRVNDELYKPNGNCYI